MISITDFDITIINLVHHIDLSWNPIYDSILDFYKNLVKIGFVYYNNEVQIVESETEEIISHV